VNVRLPRRWSRRIRLIYILVTAFGGIVLIIFLLLMWLLYWMNAPFALPGPERLIHPDATAYVVLHVGRGLNAPVLSEALADALCLGAPDQARKLALKGLNSKKCRVQAVASIVPAAGKPDAALAISLGRYPGLFSVVRKDLKRRCEKGSLNASVSHHNENEVFVGQGDDGSLNVLSLIECTMIRGSSQAITEGMLDCLINARNASPAWPIPGFVAEESGDASALVIGGWMKKWQQVPLDFVMTDPQKADLETFIADLGRAVPGITRVSDIYFHGHHRGRETSLNVSFEPATEDDPETLGKLLQDWVYENGQALAIHVSNVAVSEGRVEFDLGLRSGEE